MCAVAVQGLSDGSDYVFPTSFKLSFVILTPIMSGLNSIRKAAWRG